MKDKVKILGFYQWIEKLKDKSKGWILWLFLYPYIGPENGSPYEWYG